MSSHSSMTIDEFAKRHYPCRDGLEWALENCRDMAEVWDRAKPDWLLWIATRPGVLDDRTLRLFACWCARQVWHLLTDDRSKRAVEVAERYANGDATQDELRAARADAVAAARAAAWDAAWDAWAAAWAAARAAARSAARSAAEAARVASEVARSAAEAARVASEVARSAAEAAAVEKQAAHLRSLGNPFKENQCE